MRPSNLLLFLILVSGVAFFTLFMMIAEDSFSDGGSVDGLAGKVSEVQKKVEEYDKVCNGFKEKLDQCMTQLRYCRGY